MAAGRMNATTAARLVVAAAVGEWADRALARRIQPGWRWTEANRLAGDGVLYAAIRVTDGEASTGDVRAVGGDRGALDRARDAMRAQPERPSRTHGAGQADSRAHERDHGGPPGGRGCGW